MGARLVYGYQNVKVGIISHYMPPHQGGIERVAEMLLHSYSRHGLEVRWVASREPADAAVREGQRIRVPCWNGLEKRLQVPLPLWGPRAWSQVFALARWADVLHVHDCLYPGSVAAAVFAPHLHTPVLLSQHVGIRDYGPRGLNFVARAAYRTLGRWVLRRARCLVYVTPAAEGLCATLLGESPRHAQTIPNGVDLTRFWPASREERVAARVWLQLPNNRPVVLFVGRLVEQKGIDLLAWVIRALPSVHFLVVGDGPLASHIPVAPHVTRIQSVAPEGMRTCYQASNCLLLPSYGEGLPLVVQEAAASGLAIIISEGESYSSALIKQRACVASARTPESMLACVQNLLSGGEMDTFGERARAYAAAHWSLESMVARYITLLEELHREARRMKEGCECAASPPI